MKVKFLALFLLISGIQAMSTSDFDMNFTSEGKGLIQSNGQAHQLLGKLQGSIEDSASVKYKVEDTTQEALDTTRKTQGSSGSSGRAGGGGGADVNRRPRQSSAPSEPHFWVSKFILSVNLLFSYCFFSHYV
ncbi:hypothetical protein VNO80_05551 [Phaseolus coccineus]|uniref:Uncharacterized protein n=1 Tax=Phaseolus coccineus TaxID=3886 RepID=A0AAN9NF97_PHACN